VTSVTWSRCFVVLRGTRARLRAQRGPDGVQASFILAMRERAPKLFKELSKSGKLDEFVQLKTMQAHRLFLDLTKDAPKGSGGSPAQPWRREAEEQVMGSCWNSTGATSRASTKEMFC